MDRRDFWTDALVGSAVGIVLGFAGFLTVVSGLVAGYLCGDDGPSVGLASALLPTLLLVGGFLIAVPIIWLGDPQTTGVLVVLLIGALVWFVLYLVFGALGALVGVYVRDEYGEAIDR